MSNEVATLTDLKALLIKDRSLAAMNAVCNNDEAKVKIIVTMAMRAVSENSYLEDFFFEVFFLVAFFLAFFFGTSGGLTDSA